MRKKLRILFYMIIIGLILWGTSGVWLDFLADLFGISRSTSMNATASFVYRLSPKKDLVFSFPPTKMLRLISNATVPLGSEPLPGSSFPYVIQYDILNADGKVLMKTSFHLTATLTHFKDTVSGRRFWDSSLEDIQETPMDGKIIIINFKGLSSTPRHLRLRLQSMDNRLRGVLLRAYMLEEFPEYKQKTLWQRKSNRARAELARGNIYPEYLLTEKEKTHLTASDWEVISPQGIPGEDFTRNILLRLKRNTGVPIFPSDSGKYETAGPLDLQPGFKGVVPLPEGGGHFRFLFTPKDPGSKPEPGAAPVLTWYGRKAGEVETVTVPVGQEVSEVVFEKTLDGGIVEIEIPFQATLKVEQYPGITYSTTAPNSLSSTNQSPNPSELKLTDISPEGIYLRSYRCEPDLPLEYRVFSTEKQPVPFRLDFRVPISRVSQKSTASSVVTYRLLDIQKQVTAEGQLPLEIRPSVYDRLTDPGHNHDFVLSEKQSHYLAIPAGTEYIQVNSTPSPVLVTVYNRPPGLVKPRRVPEDDFPFNRLRETMDYRDWFYVQPMGYRELEHNGRAEGIVLQVRPPVRSPWLFSGDYQWESLSPVSRAWGRLLLVKRDSKLPVQDETRPLLYREIPLNRPVPIVFRERSPFPGVAGAGISPSLVFLKPGSEFIPVRVELNGSSYWQGNLGGSSGEVQLPVVSAGSYTLKVTVPQPVRMWINETDASGDSLYFRRLVYPTGSSPLVFRHLKKHSRETLGFQLFCPLGSGERFKLKVKIEGFSHRGNGEALKNWTFPRWEFDVRPAGGVESPVLYSGDEKLDSGESFFITLGEDVPSGELTVSLLGSGSKGYYVMPYRLAAGLFEDSRAEIISLYPEK